MGIWSIILEELTIMMMIMMMIGVSRKRVVSYYISNIDQSSTYSGFMKFLKSKGVTAAQVRLFYHKFSISTKLNIPSMYCYLVESEDFWPDRMKCRKWLEKNEWKKEQETRREEYERNRKDLSEEKERTLITAKVIGRVDMGIWSIILEELTIMMMIMMMIMIIAKIKMPALNAIMTVLGEVT